MILGVDVGKTGAVAALHNDGRLFGVADMPVVGTVISPALLNVAMAHWWEWPAPHTAVIEAVHAMPKQGTTSMFSFGRALGVVEGVLGAQGWAIEYVSPATWKKALGLNADKGMSRRRAIELWPEHAALFARAKDDGRAEAALIAHCYWKTNRRDKQ